MFRILFCISSELVQLPYIFQKWEENANMYFNEMYALKIEILDSKFRPIFIKFVIRNSEGVGG